LEALFISGKVKLCESPGKAWGLPFIGYSALDKADANAYRASKNSNAITPGMTLPGILQSTAMLLTCRPLGGQ